MMVKSHDLPPEEPMSDALNRYTKDIPPGDRGGYDAYCIMMMKTFAKAVRG
eukprot:CAMPEP_0194026892 /NCGR_PEP_ID=MMETSP0009_2-20130614/1143_1 /TAXON_ID=210454 /ORGANISM="Grammatophora oceanica, Strain CCMP 410" /LENGTH=50 /DNA_ID=CAMNT_0038665779 /DNA_START=59 /DNA_END=208 /DNA_ORIENTATION=-